MTEPNYQRPPLREEIENFFKQIKSVITAIIYLAIFIAIVIGLYKFSESDIGQQTGIYFHKHFPTFMLTSIIAIPSYLILYMALYRKHLIYKRYHIGYFSQMMWCFIGFFTLQLINIPIAIYMDDLIPIIIVETIALGITNLALSEYKKEHPTLDRPLTEEENKLRKKIIESLIHYYKINRNSFKINPSYSCPTIHDNVMAFARASYLMDVHPETLKTLDNIPEIFYTDTFDNLKNEPSINTEDLRYKKYHKRAYGIIHLYEKPDVTFSPSLKSFFE